MSRETKKSKRGGRKEIRLLIAAAILGAVSTVGVAMLSAAVMPMRALSGGVVERDGDHLELWVLEMRFPTGTRSIWFEKGRIYNKAGVGPPGGSSAAVANWSYATATRSDRRFARGEIELSRDVSARIQEQPAKVWGIAVDRHGWPWPAMEGQVAGTMDPTSASPYVALSGVMLPTKMHLGNWGGNAGTFGGSDSLADVRVLPVRPLWRGFLLDMACLTAIWWVVLRLAGRGVKAIQARRLARAGLCGKCGYDLQGLSAGVCPECGAKSVG